MKQTKETPRQYAYENEMAKSVGLRMSCNACGRLIYEDENWIEEYSTNSGYCKECAAETAGSNDSLESPLGWRVNENDLYSVFDNNNNFVCECETKESALLISEAVNNYNALKQANAELYNALAAILHSSWIDDFNSVKSNHSKLTQQAITALQKAKQL